VTLVANRITRDVFWVLFPYVLNSISRLYRSVGTVSQPPPSPFIQDLVLDSSRDRQIGFSINIIIDKIGGKYHIFPNKIVKK
jgi:hypothetical protein